MSDAEHTTPVDNGSQEAAVASARPARPVAGGRPPLASRTSKSKLIKQSAELDDDELQQHTGVTPVHKMPIPETRVESADELEAAVESADAGPSQAPTQLFQSTVGGSQPTAGDSAADGSQPIAPASVFEDDGGGNFSGDPQTIYTNVDVLGRRMAEMAVIGRRPLIRHNMGSSGSLGSSCDAISQPVGNLPPYLVLAGPAGGKVLVRSVALCGDDDTRLNPTRALLAGAGDNKQSSSKTGSCASSLSRGTSGESHAGGEYTDATGVNLEEFIRCTLHKNKKDRETLLNLEREMRAFVQDAGRQVHKFPPMSSYNRMLIHRTAAYFGLDHNVDQSGQAVVVNKTNNTRLPDTSFGSYIAGDTFADEARRQLRRDYQSCEEVVQVSDGTCLYALGPVSDVTGKGGHLAGQQRAYRKVRSFDERSVDPRLQQQQQQPQTVAGAAQPHLLQPHSAAGGGSPAVQLVPLSVPYQLQQQQRAGGGGGAARYVYVPAAGGQQWYAVPQAHLRQQHSLQGNEGVSSVEVSTDSTVSTFNSGGEAAGQQPAGAGLLAVAQQQQQQQQQAVRPWSSAETGAGGATSLHGSAEGIQVRAPSSGAHTLRASAAAAALSQKANSFGGVPVIYRQTPVDYQPSQVGQPQPPQQIRAPPIQQRQNTDARSDMSSAPSVGSAGGDSNSPLHQHTFGAGPPTGAPAVGGGGYYVPTAPYSHPIICAVASMDQVPPGAVILHPGPPPAVGRQAQQHHGGATPQAAGSGYASPVYMPAVGQYYTPAVGAYVPFAHAQSMEHLAGRSTSLVSAGGTPVPGEPQPVYYPAGALPTSQGYYVVATSAAGVHHQQQQPADAMQQPTPVAAGDPAGAEQATVTGAKDADATTCQE